MSVALLVYCFLVRLYHYPDDEMDKAKQLLFRQTGRTLSDLHSLFYSSFQRGFCKFRQIKAWHPTINIHTFMHLEESRRRTGPLHKTSAEPFEALYAVLRRCYKPGTRNTNKQMFENFYMRDKYVFNNCTSISHVTFTFFVIVIYRYAHRCNLSRPLVVRPPGKSSKVSDSIVFLHTGECFTITEKREDNKYYGHKMRLAHLKQTTSDVRLPWHKVGVHQVLGVDGNNARIIDYSEIRGKGMQCADILTEWRPEWIMSKTDV